MPTAQNKKKEFIFHQSLNRTMEKGVTYYNGMSVEPLRVTDQVRCIPRLAALRTREYRNPRRGGCFLRKVCVVELYRHALHHILPRKLPRFRMNKTENKLTAPEIRTLSETELFPPSVSWNIRVLILLWSPESSASFQLNTRSPAELPGGVRVWISKFLFTRLSVSPQTTRKDTEHSHCRSASEKLR